MHIPKKNKTKQRKEWGKSKHKMNTHHLQIEAAEDQVSFNMFNLIDLSEPRAEPINATLQINGKELEMEVDTGASASVN